MVSGSRTEVKLTECPKEFWEFVERSRARLIGWMMAARNDAPQTRQQSNLRGRPLQPDSSRDPVRSVAHPHNIDDTVLWDPSCPEHTLNNPTENQEVTGEPPSPEQFSLLSWLISLLTNDSSNETELKLESELKEKTTLIDELRSNQQAQDGHIRKLTIDLDRCRRLNQELREIRGKEVQLLKSIIEQKEKDLEAEKLHTSQFKAKCLKLEAQLVLTEQNAAQESRTSGSYSDDHANPGMLEGACKATDKATEALARFLHSNSVTKALALKSPELEQFVRRISPARPAEFSRAIQVRYVWAHWLCYQMFQGFEHVFFDADGGHLTSPLDSKNHALESFQRFQQKPSGLDSSGLFQTFCSRKYENLFPPWLVNQASFPPGIICNENGRLPGDGELRALFMDVARAVWLLHELAFSFDPPASILRMARGTPYDKQFHESVIHVEDGHGMPSQMVSLMMRPTFRVRKSIIRSRVFLCNNPNGNPNSPTAQHRPQSST